MAHENIHTSIDVIQRELSLLKKACGMDDPDHVEEVEEEVDAVKKESPRRRGRHAKGMPFFKKGEKAE